MSKLTTAPIESYAIIDGDRVILRYLMEDFKTFQDVVLSLKEYEDVKKLMSDGMIRDDYVLRPSAIHRYLKASTSASNDTAMDIEKTMMKRSMGKTMMDIMPYAIFCFLVLVGVGALYMMVSKDTGGAVQQIQAAATTTTNGLAIK